MSFFNSNIFSKSDNSVIGIDIGSSSLKIVQIKKERGRAILQTYGELGLGPYNKLSIGQIVTLAPDQLASIILDLLKEAGITTVVGGMSIPLKLSLVTVMDIPKVEEKEERNVIELEARKYIPVSIAEVTLDYSIIPQVDDTSLEFIESESDEGEKATKKEIDKKQKVLLVAIHNQVLNNYSKIVQDSKLNIQFFEVEAFATARGSLSGERSPSMIIDVGAASVKIYIIDNGVLLSSHNINRGSQDMSFSISKGLGVPFDQAEHLKRSLGKVQIQEEAKIRELVNIHEEFIISEIKTVLSTFQKKMNITVMKIILTGGGSSLDGFIDKIQKNFSCKVELADPFSKLESPVSLHETLKLTGTTFSTAIGLALRALQS
jgi:type IV pilus assembly protein PilM